MVQVPESSQSDYSILCIHMQSGNKEGLQKHNDEVIMTSFHNFGFEISMFCETGYKLSKLHNT